MKQGRLAGVVEPAGVMVVHAPAAVGDDVLEAALGFDVFRFRLAAYVIAGVIAGIAGFLAAVDAEFVSPATMSWQRSGEFIVMVVLGGMGSRIGALLGAVAFVGLEELLSTWIDHWKLVFGPLLVLVVLYAKGGLAALIAPRTGARRG